jgi:hypothetical protein
MTSINMPSSPISSPVVRSAQVPSGMLSLRLLPLAHVPPLARLPDDVGGSVIPRHIQ